MRYKTGYKEEARARIVAAAGRGFRKRGYGGIGVDGLASEADVTSGAFYSHFKSKEQAFNEVVDAGIAQLKITILSLREAHGADWVPHYVARYIGEKRVCDLAEACALQSLAAEIGRSGPTIKLTFQRRILEVAEAAAEGFEGGTAKNRIDRAMAFLAVLSGGVTLARAVEEPIFAEAIAASITSAALLISQPPKPA
jgi:TetR/AcrR family transcriptional regulator, transcriptional repressor for nem operon